MKHSGLARRAALRLVWLTLVVLAAVLLAAIVAKFLGSLVLDLSIALVFLWGVFVLFTLYFFRDPEPHVPTGRGLVLAPAHGKVDMVETTTEPRFMGNECRRISIFLSVFDVHVQYAPVAGRMAYYKHTPGQFLSALRAESALHNEHVLLGIECAEPAGERIAVRQIAGVLARRIRTWVQPGEEVEAGERLGLIQYGSRVDLYVPLRAEVRVKPGEHVRGGETVLAVLA